MNLRQFDIHVVNYNMENLTKRQKEVAQFLIDSKGHLRFERNSLNVIVYPNYQRIKKPTAKKIIECLGLKHFNGWKIYPETVVGGYGYCFPDYS